MIFILLLGYSSEDNRDLHLASAFPDSIVPCPASLLCWCTDQASRSSIRVGRVLHHRSRDKSKSSEFANWVVMFFFKFAFWQFHCNRSQFVRLEKFDRSQLNSIYPIQTNYALIMGIIENPIILPLAIDFIQEKDRNLHLMLGLKQGNSNVVQLS